MIYFDHNATTPILPEIAELVKEAMSNFWGNPSSTHAEGRKAFAELERARDRFAALLKVKSSEVFFTSGGTEADNTAIFGMFSSEPGEELIISSVEHPAVAGASRYLESKGVVVHRIPVDNLGILQVDKLKDAVTEKTKLVSIMAANNEIGTVQPLKEIGEFLLTKGVPLHTDAVQAFCKVPLDLNETNIAITSVSSHKIYGPKGCGALIIRSGTKVNQRTYGGSQERGMRTGTQNVPGILGFVRATELAYERMEHESKKLFELTEFMYSQVKQYIPDVLRNGHPNKRIPGTLSLCFPGVESQVLLAALDQLGICASGGSACHSGAIDPSEVLLAIGRRRTDAACGIRFSLGMSSSREEVVTVANELKTIIERIRALN